MHLHTARTPRTRGPQVDKAVEDTESGMLYVRRAPGCGSPRWLCCAAPAQAPQPAMPSAPHSRAARRLHRACTVHRYHVMSQVEGGDTREFSWMEIYADDAALGEHLVRDAKQLPPPATPRLAIAPRPAAARARDGATAPVFFFRAAPACAPTSCTRQPLRQSGATHAPRYTAGVYQRAVATRTQSARARTHTHWLTG